MLTRISIENFKGIGKRVDLDLKPVTLLFGPNSAGKSTFMHALQYLHTLLVTGDADVHRTIHGGDLDLGGFENVVHNHDPSKTMTIGIGFKIGDEWHPHHGPSDLFNDAWQSVRRALMREDPEFELGQQFPEEIRQGLSSWDDLPGVLSFANGEVMVDKVRPAWNQINVEVHVRWSPYTLRPFVSRFVYAPGGRRLFTIVASADGRNMGSRCWPIILVAARGKKKDLYGGCDEIEVDGGVYLVVSLLTLVEPEGQRASLEFLGIAIVGMPYPLKTGFFHWTMVRRIRMGQRWMLG